MKQPPLILIIDDEAYFREIFSAKLQAAGFRTHTAESGEQAIKDAKNLNPDLILMDVRMPGMDGVEAASRIKEDPATKNLKIVFLTNLGESEKDLQAIDEQFAREFGAAGYIKKVEDLNETVRMVKKYIDS